MEAGERQLHLGLDTGGPSDATAGGPLLQVVQQRGLADPGLAAQYQHLAVTRPHIGHQAVERLAFTAPSSETRSSMIVGHDHRPAWGVGGATVARPRQVTPAPVGGA
jgi:hypothetical protein